MAYRHEPSGLKIILLSATPLGLLGVLGILGYLSEFLPEHLVAPLWAGVGAYSIWFVIQLINLRSGPPPNPP